MPRKNIKLPLNQNQTMDRLESIGFVSTNELLQYLSLFLAPLYVVLAFVAVISRALPLLSLLSSHGKTFQSSSDWWSIQVPKRYFGHFYIFGIVSFFLSCRINNSSWTLAPAQILLLLHLLRRLYECHYVHQFRPTSHMHLEGYLLGVGHYAILPLVFIMRPSADGTYLTFPSAAFCSFNLWMQYEQFVHHHILARIRGHSNKRPTYVLPPRERWFQSVLCPHYLAEILIYISWAFLLSSQGTDPAVSFGKASSTWNAILKIGFEYRHWFLFVWVAINLTVSALRNRDWYKCQSTSETRAALVPYLI